MHRFSATLLIITLTAFWPSVFWGQNGKFSLPQNLEKALGSPTGKRIRATPASQEVSVSGGYSGEQSMMGMQYQIHVLGQVQKPGTYRFGPSVRVAEAIAMAGGMAERGGQRSIELRRSGSATEKIDLFRFYEKGDLNANPFLQDYDVIFVPFQARSVRIEGPVRKSGVFELAGEKNIWDVIQLAGGFTVGASEKGEVVVVRYENEKKRMIQVSNVAEELRRTPIQNGDIIVVPHIFTKNKEFDYAFPNLPTDDVFYPSYNDQVYVAGAVLKAGPYEYEGHLTVFDYINMAGPDPKAKVKATRVMKPDGTEVHKIKKYALNPGDTIVVPNRKLTGTNALTWYNTFASSLFTFVSLRSLMKDL
ncbi:MAG: SLBB domain-containing protein [Deltaproteobacteria bacterium]|nr:SLBB domain-containing protein [Deltaproteobacteria bacterium]